MTDATGYPLRIGQRIHVPARASRLAPDSFRPEDGSGGLPPFDGFVASLEGGHVSVWCFYTHGLAYFHPGELRVQRNRLGTVAACKYALRHAKSDEEHREAELALSRCLGGRGET